MSDSWIDSPLPKLLKLMKSGGTPDTSRSDFYGGNIPFVAIDDMTRCSRYLEKTTKTLTNEGLRNSNAWLVPTGALLYSIYATLGVPRINKIPVATNQAILALLNNPDLINGDYLYYWLSFIRDSVVNLSSQTTQSNLSASVVKTFLVSHPKSLLEQTKIAEILSTVDQAIDQTEALISKQQRIKTGLMQDLLTRGIDEDGSLRSEDTHEFKDSPLGRIPVEWEVRSINSISDFVTSGSRGWAQYYSDEGAVFLRIGNLTRDHINMRFDDTVFVRPPASAEVLRTAVLPGDILISVTADLGIIGVIPKGFGEGYVNQHIALVRISDPEVDQRFIGWFLQSRLGQIQIEKNNESGAKAGLNLPTIQNLLVASPPSYEQRHIVQILDTTAKMISRSQTEMDKQIHLKMALMQDLLTGKVSVTPLLIEAEISI